MNLREAAQQALEALEYSQGGNTWVGDLCRKAIADLRTALAEGAMQRLTDEQQEIEKTHTSVDNEYTPVQPVAWMHEWEGVATLNMTPPNYYGDHWKHTALYTAPPKRKPLTEEEIWCIDDDTPFHEGPEWFVRFTRSIERAHGIGEEE